MDQGSRIKDQRRCPYFRAGTFGHVLELNKFSVAAAEIGIHLVSFPAWTNNDKP